MEMLRRLLRSCAEDLDAVDPHKLTSDERHAVSDAAVAACACFPPMGDEAVRLQGSLDALDERWKAGPT